MYTPYYFKGAPLPIDGTYRLVWDGLDSKGTWHRIKAGTVEIEYVVVPLGGAGPGAGVRARNK